MGVGVAVDVHADVEVASAEAVSDGSLEQAPIVVNAADGESYVQSAQA